MDPGEFVFSNYQANVKLITYIFHTANLVEPTPVEDDPIVPL
jgi:hypothetical protein